MPEWVQISGEDAVMIAFACIYVLAGLGMYLFLPGKMPLTETGHSGNRPVPDKREDVSGSAVSALSLSVHLS